MGALLMTDAPDELLNIEQVAQLLGVSRPTVYKLLRAGRLIPVAQDNPVLVKQHRKFRRADVERLMRGESADN